MEFVEWPTQTGAYLCEYAGEMQECLAFEGGTNQVFGVMTPNGLRHWKGTPELKHGPMPKKFMKIAPLQTWTAAYFTSEVAGHPSIIL